MKKGELEVIINYEDLGNMFEKMEQHCIMCQHIMHKIKGRIDEAGVEARWDGKEERRKKKERRLRKNEI